jgi:hypothetical protein
MARLILLGTLAEVGFPLSVCRQAEAARPQTG